MKKIYLLSLFVIFSLNLFCQTHWTKHPDNPIIIPGDDGEWIYNTIGPNTVMLIDSIYHMYYDGAMNNSEWAIGHATSTDGITWIKDSNNPILALGAPGEWDGDWISDAFVLKVDTLFHMWYTGHTGDFHSRIGHATSQDGIEWTKDPDNPVKDLDEGVPASNYCMHAPVLYDGYQIHMYCCTGNWSSNKMEIWHATSQDGYNWIFDPLNPVMEDTKNIYATSVLFNGDQYLMWYGNGTMWNWETHLAFSKDGSSWDIYGNNPVLTAGPPGSWDELCIVRAIAIFDSTESKYRMWYGGAKTQEKERIGYAETYEPAWKQMVSMDIARGRLRSGSIGEKIYVFGGLNTDGLILDSVDVYNTETNEWTNKLPMPEVLGETNVEVIHDSMIYIVGGWTDVNQEWITTNSTVALYPEGDSWVAKENSPEATGSNASCVLHDTIYILGGKEDFNSTDVRKAWFYDASEDSWSTLPEMIYEHGVGGSANALDGKIYVIGGGTGLTLPMNPVQAEVYDGSTWQEIEDIPIPVLHQISLVHDNKILVIGGDSGAYDHQIGYATNLIQEYDPSTNSWCLYKPMPFNRSAMTGQIVDDHLYLIGGYASNDRILSNAVSEVWRFNLDSLEIWEVPCTEVILTPASLELKPDSSASLSAIVLPTYSADRTVSWASSDNGIATVSVEGVVTAVSEGEATITATANGGGCFAYCSVSVSSVGISLYGADQISVLPNPVINILVVRTSLQDDHLIEITSLNGQVFYSRTMDWSTYEIDFSSFQSGVYFITIRSKDFVTTRKIVKL